MFLVAPSSVTPNARQYIFTRFSMFNGLSANLVNNLVQDHKGYIWLATPNGLQRYDGNKFTTFKHQHSNPGTMPDDNVASVYMDKQDRLWVFTADNKVGIFDTDRFRYREVKMVYPGDRPTIYQPKLMVETKQGKVLLFASGADTYEFQPDSNKLVVTNEYFKRPANWRRQWVFMDTTSGRQWSACDSGIVMYDPATRHINYYRNNPDKNKAIDAFGNVGNSLRVYADNYGRHMVATWRMEEGGPRLLFFNEKSGEIKKHNVSMELFGGGYHEFNGILQQRNGRLWVYGLPFILEYVDGPSPLQGIQNEYKDEQSLKFDVAFYMYEDRSGNIWVTTTNGVYLFNPDAQKFNAFRLLRPNGTGVIDGPTKCVLEVDGNQLWVGTWGAGIYAYDRNFNPQELPAFMKGYETGAVAWCMVQHKAAGLIFIGMQDGAMAVINRQKQQQQIHLFPIFERRTIRQAVEDKNGNLWFGTQQGKLVKWTYQPGRHYQDGFTEILRTKAIIQKLLLDKQGYLWVATQGRGPF